MGGEFGSHGSGSLATLVAGLGLAGAADDRPMRDIVLDSRKVQPGSLYVALPGRNQHGARFAQDAVTAGAAAILTDASGAVECAGLGVPVLVSSQLRADMATISVRFFDAPGRELELFGVTGTNGKTTTAALLADALAANDRRSATIGTLGCRLGDEVLQSGRTTVTTPEAPDLQESLAQLRARGVQSVALEVSSHALHFERVTGLEFAVVGFLNLGRDHLDFHATLDDYFDTKARLFTPAFATSAVVWLDDPRSQQLMQRARQAGLQHLVTVGHGQGDYRLLDYTAGAVLGGKAQIEHRGHRFELTIQLPGRYNMIDALVALAMLETAGYDRGHILSGLARAQVPGRMQRVALPAGAPLVVVDFAHTPQAITAALSSLRQASELIAVFGCGGDRDSTKRSEMGAAAAEVADLVIVTDDNPRFEDPAAIRAAALAGARQAARQAEQQPRVVEVAGRRAAIETALREASGDSVVAVLGKGHETGQIVAGVAYDFDDVTQTQAAWQALNGGET